MNTIEVRKPTNKPPIYKIDGKFYYREPSGYSRGVFRNIDDCEDTIEISSKPLLQKWTEEEIKQHYGRSE
jgi:hypothetical protein